MTTLVFGAINSSRSARVETVGGLESRINTLEKRVEDCEAQKQVLLMENIALMRQITAERRG